jgi:hypothetical protein
VTYFLLVHKNLHKVANFDNSYYDQNVCLSENLQWVNLTGFIAVLQHMPCCDHLQLHIHFHFQHYLNLLAGSQALPIQN